MATSIRDYLTGKGYNVDWNPDQGVLINQTPIDVSKFSLENDKYYGDIKDIDAAVKNIPLQNNLQQPMQTSPYQNQQLMDTLKQIQSKIDTGFQYNPNQDQALQQAQGQVRNQVLNEMTKRGIADSNITTTAFATETAKLIPQFRQIAYGQYQDELSRLNDMADFVMRLDKENYNRVQDQWARDWQQKEFDYKQELNNVELERQQINDAWDRVNNLGYVDNEASLILGIPVGTPSQRVSQLLQQREFELADYEKQLQDKIKQDIRNFEQQKEIMRLKEQEDIRSDQRREQQIIRQEQRQQQQKQQEPTFDSQNLFKQADDYIQNFLINTETDELDNKTKKIDRPQLALYLESYYNALIESGIDTESASDIVNGLANKYNITEKDLPKKSKPNKDFNVKDILNKMGLPSYGG